MLNVSLLWWGGWDSNPLTCEGTGLQPAATLQLRRLPISILKAAEHPIGTLTPCGTSIVYLLVEFEPLTIATELMTLLSDNLQNLGTNAVVIRHHLRSSRRLFVDKLLQTRKVIQGLG